MHHFLYFCIYIINSDTNFEIWRLCGAVDLNNKLIYKQTILKMKKLSVLMSALVMALFFVACESDDEPTPTIKLNPDAVEVVVEGESAVVEVSGGNAPYTITISDIEIADASIDESKITITGVAEGETTINVKDNDGVEGSVKVTVKAKGDEGDDAEGDDTEGDDNEGGEE